MRRISFGLFLCAALALGATSAKATVIMETLPEFSFDGGPIFPSPEQLVATFNFVIPLGEIIVNYAPSDHWPIFSAATNSRETSRGFDSAAIRWTRLRLFSDIGKSWLHDM